MAAYHWEARRRQMQAERRLRLRLRQEREAPRADPLQDVSQDGKAEASPPSSRSLPPKPALQDAAEPPCTCNTAHVQQHSGKLLNRHSSTEYIQQW